MVNCNCWTSDCIVPSANRYINSTTPAPQTHSGGGKDSKSNRDSKSAVRLHILKMSGSYTHEVSTSWVCKQNKNYTCTNRRVTKCGGKFCESPTLDKTTGNCKILRMREIVFPRKGHINLFSNTKCSTQKMYTLIHTVTYWLSRLYYILFI